MDKFSSIICRNFAEIVGEVGLGRGGRRKPKKIYNSNTAALEQRREEVAA